MGALIGAAGTPAEAGRWRDILTGVLSVQNGVNVVADFFQDCAALLYAVAMWRHPTFGRLWSLLSVMLVAPHFVLKIATFPTPPAQAGWFDAGPLVAVWFGAVILWVLWQRPWASGAATERA